MRRFCQNAFYTQPRAFSSLRAKIAHLMEVPASRSDLENSISRLRASTTRLIEFSKSAVNSNYPLHFFANYVLTSTKGWDKLY